MHEWIPKHLHIGTARIVYDKETVEGGDKSEYGKKYTGHKKRSPNGLILAKAYHPQIVTTP